MSRTDGAADLHARGANCAQSVACAFCADLGMDETATMRAATGFGGGMGRLAGTCGAVTGAFMVLGLARGMSRPEQSREKEAVYGLVREFASRFSRAHGALACRDLLGLDIGTPEGHAKAKELNLFATRCTGYIRGAVEILEGMLRE